MLIYEICFGVGLVFAVFTALFGHIFGGHDVDGHIDTSVGTHGDADTGYESGGMPGISILSPTVIASFITAVGGLGIVFSNIDSTKEVWISAPLSVVGGIIIAAGVFWMFNALFTKTQSTSESRVATLIGQTATIITPIPPVGVGEIAYVQSGTRYSAPARNDGGGEIGNGRAVKIVRIVGSQFYVQPV